MHCAVKVDCLTLQPQIKVSFGPSSLCLSKKKGSTDLERGSGELQVASVGLAFELLERNHGLVKGHVPATKSFMSSQPRVDFNEAVD